MKKVLLDNGVVITVKRMAEREQLRAAAIFNPKVVDAASRGIVKNADAIALWQGNEAYIMYIIEWACELTSSLPAGDGWIKRLRRHAHAYHIDVESLDDPQYQEALYIRYTGMTTDRYVQIVTDIAMGLKRKGATVVRDEEAASELVEDDDAIEGELVDDEDETGDVQEIVSVAKQPARKAQGPGARLR